jgi:hypothetical protein
MRDLQLRELDHRPIYDGGQAKRRPKTHEQERPARGKEGVQSEPRALRSPFSCAIGS